MKEKKQNKDLNLFKVCAQQLVILSNKNKDSPNKDKLLNKSNK